MSKKAYGAIISVVVVIMVLALIFFVLSLIHESNDVQGEIEEYISSEELHIDMSGWNYDEDNNVYWQIGVVYCSAPETTEYESMGIYVPGDYMDGVENSDGTYTCTVNTENTVGNYTAETAPIVMPINTAGYSAQEAPTSYSYNGLSDYLDAGFVYVYCGARGRNNGDDYSGGAPWGVTDFKAAIRYLRYNAEDLPGDTESIFTFGHSGGGAQSSLIGATGDSEDYIPYLESIGAVIYDDDGNYISDAIAGAMCWCPITSLDTANEAYEWNMGQYSDSGTRSDDAWTSALSDDLAKAYAAYINALELVDEDGNVLELEETVDGIYTSGSYYDYVLSVIEGSLNNFLEDTEFPYTSGGSSDKADGGFGGAGDSSDEKPSGELPDGDVPDGDLPSGDAPEVDVRDVQDGSNLVRGEKNNSEIELEVTSIEDGSDLVGDDLELEVKDIQDGSDLVGDEEGLPDGTTPGDNARGANNSSTESVTYETAADYIAALNSDEEWVIYDEETNTVSITSIEAFVNHCKSASKDVGAFDDLDREQAENYVFGNDDSDALHWDSTMAELLEDNWDEYTANLDIDTNYAEEYSNDMNNVDKLGVTTEERQNMYNPMYYLCDYYDGYETSTVAKYWRIRTGITQGDTALTVETNLALALENYDEVEEVDFETIWEQGHTTAERTGDSTTNFIEWVNECLGN